MNVWIRIYSSIGEVDRQSSGTTLTVSTELGIVIHRNEKSARAAAAIHGGIVLEVAASSIKGVSEFPDISLIKTDADNGTEDDPDKAPSNAFVQMACDDVPHKRVFQSLTTGAIGDTPAEAMAKDDPDNPQSGEYQELMEFTDEGHAFLDALSVALGDMDMHQ